jgi:hypothetical protein
VLLSHFATNLSLLTKYFHEKFYTLSQIYSRRIGGEEVRFEPVNLPSVYNLDCSG